MILSDRQLKECLIHPEMVREAREWWENGRWDLIQQKILIDPFRSYRLGPCSYDLSVGDEYISIRDPDDVRTTDESRPFYVSPGETALILTEEYICLPRSIMGTVVPRARLIFEGTSVCSTRIEPT